MILPAGVRWVLTGLHPNRFLPTQHGDIFEPATSAANSSGGSLPAVGSTISPWDRATGPCERLTPRPD